MDHRIIAALFTDSPLLWHHLSDKLKAHMDYDFHFLLRGYVMEKNVKNMEVCLMVTSKVWFRIRCFSRDPDPVFELL